MSHPAQYFATHRLMVSRIFALAFILTVLAAESAHEGNLISTGLFLVGLVLVGIVEVVEALHEYHYVKPLIHLF